MKLTMFVACLLLLPALATPVHSVLRSQAPTEVAGVYACRGARADGQAYQGVVHIFRQNDVYHVLWDFGREQHLGVGIVTNNVLAVSYAAGVPGVVAYRIEAAEGDTLRLVGQWTMAGAEGVVFGEILTRLSLDAGEVPLVLEAPSPETQPARPLMLRPLKAA